MAQPVVSLRVILPMMDLSLDPISFSLEYERETGTGVNPDQMLGLCTNLAKTMDATQSSPLSGTFPFSCDRSTGGARITGTEITGHLDGSPAGSPTASYPWTVATSSSTNALPEGCAGVVSFRSDYGTDPEFVRAGTPAKVVARPRATHRNRIYLPLNAGQVTPDGTSNRAKIASSWLARITTWLGLITTLSDVFGGTGNTWKWIQWSKKMARVANIVQAWADDRPDYQRRRTDPSGNRTVWGVTETGLLIVERQGWAVERNGLALPAG